MPTPLVASTVKAAGILAATPAAAGLISVFVASVKGAWKVMLHNKGYTAAALLLSVAVVGIGTGIVLSQAHKPDKQASKKVATHTTSGTAKATVAQGKKADKNERGRCQGKNSRSWRESGIAWATKRTERFSTVNRRSGTCGTQYLFFQLNTPTGNSVQFDWSRKAVGQTACAAPFKIDCTTRPRGN